MNIDFNVEIEGHDDNNGDDDAGLTMMLMMMNMKDRKTYTWSENMSFILIPSLDKSIIP